MDEMRRDFQQIHLENQALAENEHEVLPPILHPENADTLIEVISKLDPFAFAKLSKTCRYLYDICWNANGIKIPLNCVVEVNMFKTRIWTGDKNHFYDNQRNRKDLTDAQIEELVQKKPKQFQIQLLNNAGIRTRFAKAREFLGLIGCDVTERFWFMTSEFGMNFSSHDVIQFVEEYEAKEFRSNIYIEEDAVTRLCQNMASLHLENHRISTFAFEGKMPPRLHFGRPLTFDEFMKVLKAWTRCHFDIEQWTLRTHFHPWYDCFVYNFVNHFPSYCILAPFFRLPLPSVRPLLLMEQNKNKLPRYLLRNDGQVLGIFFKQNNPDNVSEVYLRQLKPAYLHRKLPMVFPPLEIDTDNL